MDNKNSKALIVTAHADDETIWMGGTILTFKDWHWRIIQLAPLRGKTDRFLELQKAVKKYKENGVIDITIETVGLKDTMDSEEIKVLKQEALLRQFLAKKHDELSDFSLVFTHNSKGEYWYPNGHAQHILVNKVVSDIFQNRNVYQFCCPVHGEDLSNAERVQIIADIIKIKRKIFDSCYSSEVSLWDNIWPEMNFEFNRGEEVFIKNQQLLTG